MHWAGRLAVPDNIWIPCRDQIKDSCRRDLHRTDFFFSDVIERRVMLDLNDLGEHLMPTFHSMGAGNEQSQ